MHSLPTLLVPGKADAERGAVMAAWEAAGGKVMPIDKFWERPPLAPGEAVAIYGNDTFALVLAQVLGLDLLMPDDTLITRLPHQWTKRGLQLLEIGEVEDFDGFIRQF